MRRRAIRQNPPVGRASKGIPCWRGRLVGFVISLRCFVFSAYGDEGTRTPDPRVANAMLSQLSYIPAETGPAMRVLGFEPRTSALSELRSSQLSYTRRQFRTGRENYRTMLPPVQRKIFRLCFHTGNTVIIGSPPPKPASNKIVCPSSANSSSQAWRRATSCGCANSDASIRRGMTPQSRFIRR